MRIVFYGPLINKAYIMKKPLIEPVDELEFTNRKPEMAFIWEMAEKAKKRLGFSVAIISRKGVGKTALLVRAFNELFTQQNEVIPFYLGFGEYKDDERKAAIGLKDLAWYYFKSLVEQYLAFHLKKPEWIAKDQLSMQELEKIAQDHHFDDLKKRIQRFDEFYHQKQYMDAFRYARSFTNIYLYFQEERGIFLVDEFQMLTNVFDSERKGLVDVAGTFQKVAEAKWCPMIVSGSSVSLISKTVFGGMLTRRFSPYYLKPFTQEHSVEYAFKLAQLQQIKITEPIAIEIHELTGGNPFYIWCLFNSFDPEGKELSDSDKLQALYEFEMNDQLGKFKGFWDTHFQKYIKLINENILGLKLLNQLVIAQEEMNINDLSEFLGLDSTEVKQALIKLEQADLVERQTGSIYNRITDPVLAEYISKEYQTEIRGISLHEYLDNFRKEFRRKMGSLSQQLGQVAELYTRHLLMNFAGQTVDGQAIFGTGARKFKLPNFKRVEHRGGVIIKGEQIEFDLLAEGDEVWLIEVKYWKQPVGVSDVEQLAHKVERLAGWGMPLPEYHQVWFFSRNAFNTKASERLSELGILHSDVSGFNQLCRAVGIGQLPVEEA